MAKIIKLTESDLEQIVKKVLKEQSSDNVNPKNLKLGDRGPEVEKLQQRLIDMGVLILRNGPTGYFGELTQRGLARSQGKPVTPATPTTGQPKTQTQKFPVKGNLQGNTGQSKVISKDPTDINSYPSCVRFSKPNNSASGVYKLLNKLGANYGQWQIPGKNFYEGYYFFNNGKYVSLLSNKTGTYFCNNKNKLILDIAAKASDPNTKKSGNYKYSPRIDAEVQHIKNRKMDDTPFLVYDPRENLIYLFDTGGVYITSSQVVDGADAQKGLSDAKAFTREDWCKISGMESKPQLCTDKTGTKKDPFYGPIANLTARFLPKGIYTINGLSYHQGYTGGAKGGAKNTFGLKPIKLEGTITAAASKGLSAAIHGIPGEEGRLKASKELETLLRADVNSGKVPSQYLDNIQAILNANKSFGCIGVPASFVNNPKVQSVIAANVNKIKVFAMGEDSQDFLVKNDDKPKPGLDDYQSTIA
jgi:peptidoglycan hydrolase-like protein with peptidoglycan-binding domain